MLPEDFTDGLWKYFSNPDLCQKHGSKGRKHILEKYKWETVTHNFKVNVLDKFKLNHKFYYTPFYIFFSSDVNSLISPNNSFNSSSSLHSLSILLSLHYFF